MSDTPDKRPTLVYCHCAYAKVIPEETKRAVLRKLAESGVAFEAVPDLCEMSARKDPAMRRLRDAAPVRIAACYPRAVHWLFAAGDAALPEGGADILNMRELDADTVLERLLGDSDAPPEPPEEGSDDEHQHT